MSTLPESSTSNFIPFCVKNNHFIAFAWKYYSKTSKEEVEVVENNEAVQEADTIKFPVGEKSNYSLFFAQHL